MHPLLEGPPSLNVICSFLFVLTSSPSRNRSHPVVSLHKSIGLLSDRLVIFSPGLIPSFPLKPSAPTVFFTHLLACTEAMGQFIRRSNVHWICALQSHHSTKSSFLCHLFFSCQTALLFESAVLLHGKLITSIPQLPFTFFGPMFLRTLTVAGYRLIHMCYCEIQYQIVVSPG